MNLLHLYHHLPLPLRSMVATARGYGLRRQRYGADTEQLVAAAIDRESWGPTQWQSWYDEELAVLLESAATTVPYYREIWEERRRRGDQSSWELLENWPVLEKENLRQNPHGFIAEGENLEKLSSIQTSGTTGKPLRLWQSRNSLRQWYALFEARCRRWYGVSRDDNWAILGGQLVTPVTQKKPPFWVWNAALKQLYMSSYHLSPALIDHYLGALERYQVTYLYGYTSSLYELALAAMRAGKTNVRMKVVITNAEPVFDYQRSVIEEAFRCRVRESYGMAEKVAAASECESGSLHLWPEVGRLESIDGDGTRVNQGTGELLATGLLNAAMPLIRYRVGDRVAMSEEKSLCACGRALPAINAVQGRVDDVLYTRDGRHIGRLDPVFKSDLPILEAQIVQESLERIKVRYVPTDGFNAKDAASITERLRDRMGDVDVVLEPLTQLPRTSNGKFRAVVCELSDDLKRELSESRLPA
jgi:phenylacetate-CoA ligase